MPPPRTPNLRALYAAHENTDLADDTDVNFRYGLNRVFDGIEARLRTE